MDSLAMPKLPRRSVLVRLALPSDLSSVVSMRVALWPDSPEAKHASEARAILNGTPRGTLPLVVMIAECDASIAGFVEVGLRSHADGCDPVRPVGYVEGWYVTPAHRRRGVGRALIEAAEDWSRAQGCTELASDTWLANEDSQRAHAGLGFEIVDRCVNFRKQLG